MRRNKNKAVKPILESSEKLVNAEKVESAEKIQWHSAFRQALRAELSDYRDALDFIEEFPLTTEPIRIDIVIIKKPPELIIEKNIGRTFLGHNIVEFKSPEDTLNVDAYNKTFSYAYLYASQTHTDIKDVTITLAVSRRPRDLLNYLEADPNHEIEASDAGICYVTGERIPVQIIETKALPEEDNLWLNSLRSGLTQAALERLAGASKPYGNEISAYIYAVLEANAEILKGANIMSYMSLAKTMMEHPAFSEVFEELGFGNTASIAKNLLSMNTPVETIAAATGLTLEEVEALRGAPDAEAPTDGATETVTA